MESYTRKFRGKIKRAKDIILITHRSPDLDAFCSMLSVSSFLKKYFPKKQVRILSRQYPSINIPYMKEIEILKNIGEQKCSLLIVTDASDLSLCLEDEDSIQFKDIVFIDHHKTEFQNGYLTINEMRSSATEQVFVTFFDMLGRRFNISKEVAELTQYGIVADTGRFLYDITTSDTFRVFADVKDVSSVDLEDFGYRNSKFPKEVTPAVIEYLKSLTIVGDMAYMYIERDADVPKNGVNEAQAFLRDRYLRSIQGVHWGFIIKPNYDKEDNWFVSFRSTKGYQDVSVIAEKLGGGGHVYSAGLPIEGKSAKEILDKVLSVISSLQH